MNPVFHVWLRLGSTIVVIFQVLPLNNIVSDLESYVVDEYEAGYDEREDAHSPDKLASARNSYLRVKESIASVPSVLHMESDAKKLLIVNYNLFRINSKWGSRLRFKCRN